jgi:Predicted AAA-ATPase
MQKLLPIGIQDFSTLIEGNYLYIDKTKYILDLIAKGRFYFLSRPRRFGKSLLLSTLSEIFAGKRELFEGLYIGQSN